MRYQLLLIVVIFLTACNSKVKQANKRGLEYMKQNLYEQAITEFDNALSINNTWFPVYYNRAIAKMALYQSEEALKDLEIASRLGFEAADKVIADYFKN